jgi:HSP20 family protein
MPRRRQVDRLQEEIEELFAELWQVPRFAGTRRAFRPPVDCFRTEDPPQLTVRVELPGVDPRDVHISATPPALVVAGERRRPAGADRVYQQMEIADGPFERQIPLDEDVDTTAATATYADGVLEIVLPLARRAERPVTVAIYVGARS